MALTDLDSSICYTCLKGRVVGVRELISIFDIYIFFLYDWTLSATYEGSTVYAKYLLYSKLLCPF